MIAWGEDGGPLVRRSGMQSERMNRPNWREGLTQDERDKLHVHLLDIFAEFDRICRAHGIRYYLVAGSLLGAVRHQGIIPWDDDVDVGLLRPDYEQFVRVAPKELRDRYFLQTAESDPDYFLCYAKIRLSGTTFVEATSVDCDIHHGVYIDIFSLDNVPESPAMRRLHAGLCKLLNVMVLARGKYRDFSPVKNCVASVLRTFLRPIPFPTLKAWLQAAIQLSRNDESSSVVMIGPPWSYRRGCAPRHYFDDPIELDFGGHSASAPAMWHDYLTHLYGDYMTPPPEDEKGKAHAVVDLQL
jgi:lipopolysaccharide cholinephosphotransferase